jgi:hypothetical protein
VHNLYNNAKIKSVGLPDLSQLGGGGGGGGGGLRSVARTFSASPEFEK